VALTMEKIPAKLHRAGTRRSGRYKEGGGRAPVTVDGSGDILDRIRGVREVGEDPRLATHAVGKQPFDVRLRIPEYRSVPRKVGPIVALNQPL
jgi:hypothetical protein